MYLLIFLQTLSLLQLFNKGIKLAVNVGLSVSRVGSAAQAKAMKKVAGSIKLNLAQYREMEAFEQFGSDLDESTQQLLESGKRLTEMLKQHQHETIAMEEQVILMFAANNHYLKSVEISKIGDFSADLLKFFHEKYQNILDEIRKEKIIKDEKQILKAIDEYKDQSVF